MSLAAKIPGLASHRPQAAVRKRTAGYDADLERYQAGCLARIEVEATRRYPLAAARGDAHNWAREHAPEAMAECRGAFKRAGALWEAAAEPGEVRRAFDDFVRASLEICRLLQENEERRGRQEGLF